MTKELTGRHVLIIALSAFAVIICANMTMLFAAKGSFPGLVVKNAYVASQGWNDRATRQTETGWVPEITYDGGLLEIRLSDAEGLAISTADLSITVGRPASDTGDVVLQTRLMDGLARLPMALDPGQWRIALSAGTGFRTTAQLYVPEAR